MAAELDAYEQFILNTLRADATLMGLVGSRCFLADGVPQGSATPYIAVGTVSSIDQVALPITVRMYTNPTAYVAVTFSGIGVGAARTIASRIDEVLSGATGTLTLDGISYLVDQVTRNGERRVPANATVGVQFAQRGAEYRSWVFRL